MRGGSWNNDDTDNFRCANRNNNHPDNRNDNYGFRAASISPGQSPRCHGGAERAWEVQAGSRPHRGRIRKPGGGAGSREANALPPLPAERGHSCPMSLGIGGRQFRDF